MKVLVTGATGFVGRALVAALRARGDAVRALVRAGSSPVARARLERRGATLCEGDVEDEGTIEAAARGVDAVVHAAGRRGPGGALREHERVNLIGTENALAAARRAGVRRFVFLSCEAVTAGNYHRDYVDENFPHSDAFPSAFAETKALAEALVMAAHGQGGMETVALRPGWVWGADDNALLPELIVRARAKTLTLIDGGRARVPTTHVANLVDAIGRALRTPAAAGNVYYVTDDERITCKQFLAHLLTAVNLSAPRRTEPYVVAYALAWMGEKLGRAPAMSRADVVRFGRTAHFNLGRVRAELGYDPVIRVEAGARALAAWAHAVGGADVIARGEVLEEVSEPAAEPA